MNPDVCMHGWNSVKILDQIYNNIHAIARLDGKEKIVIHLMNIQLTVPMILMIDAMIPVTGEKESRIRMV